MHSLLKLDVRDLFHKLEKGECINIFLRPDETMLKIWQKFVFKQFISVHRERLEHSST